MKKSKDKMSIRFNLGRGDNYMKWKIITKHPSKNIYLDPNDCILLLINCKLHNNREQANIIFEGASKRVCAWVECDDIRVVGRINEDCYGGEIMYNPRVAPYWRDSENNDLDGSTISNMITLGNKLYEKVK